VRQVAPGLLHAELPVHDCSLKLRQWKCWARTIWDGAFQRACSYHIQHDFDWHMNGV